MTNSHVVVFDIFLIILLTSINCEKKLNVSITRFEKVIEDKNDFSVDLRLEEPDDQGIIKLSGEIRQMVMLNNDWKVQISMQHEDKRLEILPIGACHFLATHYKLFFYEKLKEFANAPHPETCPLPPKNYEIKSYPLDGSEFKKFLKPGTYTVNAKLFKGDELKMEYLIEADVQ